MGEVDVRGEESFLGATTLITVNSNLVIGGAFTRTPRPTSFSVGQLKGNKGVGVGFFPCRLGLGRIFAMTSFSHAAAPSIRIRVRCRKIVKCNRTSVPPCLKRAISDIVAFLDGIGLRRFGSPFRLRSVLTCISDLDPNSATTGTTMSVTLRSLMKGLLKTP